MLYEECNAEYYETEIVMGYSVEIKGKECMEIGW